MNQKWLKVKRRSLIYAFICIPCLEPVTIQSIYHVKLIFNAWRVLAFIAVMIYACIKKYKISGLVIWEGIFSAILIFSTILSRGNIVSSISTAIAILTITMITEIGVKRDFRKYISVLAISYMVNLSIDSFQVFSGIGFEPTTNAAWLGGDNFAIFAVLPMMGIIILNSYIQKNKIDLACFIIVAISVATKFYTFAGTSMIALVVWFFFLFFFNKVECSVKIKCILIAFISMLFVIVCLNFQDLFMAISRALGKDGPVEHSRLEIWRLSIQAVLRKPVLGYGVLRLEDEATAIAGWNWSTCSHTHNYLLEIVFRSGLVGLIAYLFIIKDGVALVIRKNGYRSVNVVRATLIAQAVLGFSDSYYALSPFYVLLVFSANYKDLQQADSRIMERCRI